MQGKGVLFAHRSPLELAYMLLDMGDPEVKWFGHGDLGWKEITAYACMYTSITEFFTEMLFPAVKHSY